MEIGVCLPSSGPKISPENIVTMAQWAEKLGYHSVWVTDHVVLPEKVDSYYPYDPDNRWPYPAETNWLDPVLVLAWAGVAAPRLKLGTSILILPLRNPIILAKQLSTLDFLSGGRVILGAGVGWMREEFDLIGAPFAGRGSRAVEMVELMRALWTGETVNFQGEFWKISGCQMHPHPIQRPTIPVVWGGHSEHTLRRIARMGDGWHPTQIPLEQLAEGLKKLRKFCEEYGRDPASLLIIARPHRTYPVNAETNEWHRELGVHQVVLDPAGLGPDLSACKEEMQRMAETCGLQPRN